MLIAHPTEYAGTRFRSRLEAKWAAFFDLAGWRWEYEPLDEAGWVPDFLLIGQRHTVKVEVKPIAWFADPATALAQVQEYPGLEKVWNYVGQAIAAPRHYLGDYPGEDVLICGSYPLFGTYHNMLGIFALERGREQWGVWSHCDIARLGGGYAPRRLDFYADAGSHAYRMGGQHDGNSHIVNPPDDAEALWRQACNATQWQPAKHLT